MEMQRIFLWSVPRADQCSYPTSAYSNLHPILIYACWKIHHPSLDCPGQGRQKSQEKGSWDQRQWYISVSSYGKAILMPGKIPIYALLKMLKKAPISPDFITLFSYSILFKLRY